METEFKDSLIKNWWIAPKNDKMQFINIFNNGSISIQDNLIVMGYLNNKKDSLACSTNNVTKIIKEGIVTAQGTFYSFNEAHNLYLDFLLLVNNPNTVIANRWSLIDNNTMIANLIFNIGTIIYQDDAIFDFKVNNNNKILMKGYSEKLKANIVLSPFNIRHQCLLLGIKNEVLNSIFKGMCEDQEEKIIKIKQIKNRIKF